jgi:hypothetical protein
MEKANMNIQIGDMLECTGWNNSRCICIVVAKTPDSDSRYDVEWILNTNKRASISSKAIYIDLCPTLQYSKWRKLS